MARNYEANLQKVCLMLPNLCFSMEFLASHLSGLGLSAPSPAVRAYPPGPRRSGFVGVFVGPFVDGFVGGLVDFRHRP